MSAKVKPRTKTKPRREARKPRAKRTPKKTVAARAKPPKPGAEPAAKPPPAQAPVKTFLAVVRLQGPISVPQDVENAMRALRLKNRFNATLLEKNEATLWVLRTVKDYVTWGEVDSTQIGFLLQEKGEVTGGGHVTDEYVKAHFGRNSISELAEALVSGEVELKSLWQKGINPVLRLHPPPGGFDGSIKRSFTSRGELGYRGSEIAGLVKRMA